MARPETDELYTKLDRCFSIVEFNLTGDATQFASSFAMEYYVRRIQRSEQYRVAHLTSFLYDTDRIAYIVDRLPLVSPTLHDSLSENVLVWQCLSLAKIYDIVNELLLSFADSSIDKTSFDLVVIEDLDEAFNIASFENYILAAGKTITNIVRTIRKLSQTYDVTFILAQRKPRMNYNVKHVGRLVRSMLDNHVLVNGSKVVIDCVYDNL